MYRYNAQGQCGPVEPHGTSAARLYLERRAEGELSEIVRARPETEVERVVRWRRIDLKHLIKERFGVVMT